MPHSSAGADAGAPARASLGSSEVSFTAPDPTLLKAIGIDRVPKMDLIRAVYANRDLNLAGIKLVGFDMDYTLAIYKKLPMEQLQYDLTARRLVEQGYPKEIEQLEYDPRFIVRGLIIDKRNGHLLKMDIHGRVGHCFRGRKRLSPAEIETAYRHTRIHLASESFASIDTLFSMPEACLYANIVSFFEERLARGESLDPLTLPEGHETDNVGPFDTWKLFDDVRRAIDGIHRDGTLKSIIKADLPTYIAKDENLALTLHKFRSSGKRLFVLTNSYWAYTDAVMTYLLDGRLREYPDWKGYFDIVMVGGRKPGFFKQRSPFLVVDQQTGETQQLDDSKVDSFTRGTVYQHGNIETFEKLTGCTGEEILYVGDHIFGDILRSKKDSRWRTCLIVEELDDEIRGVEQRWRDVETLGSLDIERHRLDDAIAHQRALLSHLEVAAAEADGNGLPDTTLTAIAQTIKNLRWEIDQAKRALRSLDHNAREHQDRLELRFNESWGRLLKQNNELSRFGAQITLYACTYTSLVSNFLQYSPMHYFRAPREIMSHDIALGDRYGRPSPG